MLIVLQIFKVLQIFIVLILAEHCIHTQLKDFLIFNGTKAPNLYYWKQLGNFTVYFFHNYTVRTYLFLNVSLIQVPRDIQGKSILNEVAV